MRWRATSHLIVPLWLLLTAVAGCFLPTASAQVIIIDPEAVKNAAKALPLDTPVHLSVSVIRFLPQGKASRSNAPLPTNGTLPEIVDTLGKRGQVNLLFYGERDLAGPTNATVRFNSTEKRPVFSLDADTNRSLTNREFGLRLELIAHSKPDQRIQLDWIGEFSWSPQMLDAWVGEKYLLFGMRVAKLIKPGSVYSDDEDEDAGQGINIGGLFKRKPKETKQTKAAPDLSFIAIERRAINLKGRNLLKPGEMIITMTPAAEASPDQPEQIFLVLQLAAVN